MTEFLTDIWDMIRQFAEAEILTVPRLVETIGLMVILGLSSLLTRPLLSLVPERFRGQFPDLSAYLAVAAAMLATGEGIGRGLGEDPIILASLWRLAIAWIVILLASSFIKDGLIRRLLTWAALAIAGLTIFGLLDPVTQALDGIGFTLGEVRLTLLSVLQGATVLFGLLWLSSILGRLTDTRLSGLTDLEPSAQVLFSKIVRLTLIGAAFMIAMTVIGVDITAFAVFGGALGVGIGFGLQKVVANFISGLILLADRSIKPGDVIEIGDSYGRIDRLGARFVSVVTRDGKEHLIPNEDLITQQVINWSFSSKIVRVKIPFGVAYDSDLRLVQKIAMEAAEAVPRALADPAPRCNVMALGESSVDLELRIWIRDPEDGVANVGSEVILELWDRFHENDIHFPFPQREVRVLGWPEGLNKDSKD
ncbi:MAG: mechanosensitive ion channel domain-containing protein [Alphaproteobacteria bacterium]